MAWLYVPAVVVSKRAYRSSYQINTELFVLSSGKPMPRPLSWRGWKRREWISTLSGMMLKPSTASHGVELWISSLAATRASLSVSPGKVLVKTTRAISGLISGGLYGKLNRVGAFSRTSQPTLPVDIPPSKGSLKKMATELRKESSRRRKLAHRIFESGCLSSQNWPTPQTRDFRSGDVPGNKRNQRKQQEGWSMNLNDAVVQKKWATPTAVEHKGRGPNSQQVGISNQVKNWATPTVNGNHNRADLSDKAGDGLSTQVKKSWPTPTSSEHKYRLQGNSQQSKSLAAITRSQSLTSGPRALESSNTNGNNPGQLNPAWVESLMGWANGQSLLACSATEWSRHLLRWRLWLFGEICMDTNHIEQDREMVKEAV